MLTDWRSVVLAALVLMPSAAVAGERLTVEEAKADIRAFFALVRDKHVDPYRHHDETVWRRAEAELLAREDVRDPAVLLVELSRALDLARDGHCGIYPSDRFADIFDTFPVRFRPFPDGLYVIAAAEELRPLVGGRVRSFGGVDAAEALRRFYAASYHDNRPGKLQLVEEYLRMPRIHHVLGTAPTPNDIALEIEAADGQRRFYRLGDHARATTSFEIGPPRRPLPEGWVGVARDGGERVPLWQRDLGRAYWFAPHAATSSIYVQLVKTFEDEEASIPDFAREFAEAVAAPDIERVIIDLRNNRGGDHSLTLPLFHEILRARKLGALGGIFVLTSPYTNSAAVTFASMLEKHTNAIFVGEPTAAPPGYNAEAEVFHLPHSRFEVELSRYRWVNSDPRDRRRWMHPDIEAPMTFAAYASSRDPAFEAIRNALAKGALPQPQSRRGSWHTYFNWARPSQKPAIVDGGDDDR